MDREDYGGAKQDEEEDYNELFKGKTIPLDYDSCPSWRRWCWKDSHYESVCYFFSIFGSYVRGSLPKNSVPTIGIEFAAKTVTLKNNVKIKAQIWDTGN